MGSHFMVDVIVPVYGVEKYIERSLLSICNQNYTNYRIIVVNDGTTDDSAKIAYNVLKYSKVNYLIINQENRGLSGARNTGLRVSSAKYVVFVDSDDVVTSDFISSLCNACEINHSMAAFTDYEITSVNKREGKNSKNRGMCVYDRDDLLLFNMKRKIKIHLCATMLNRSFLLQNDLFFDENLRFGEEVDYTWRLFPLLDKIVHIKSPKYKYLIRPNSLMTMQDMEKVLFLLNHMHYIISKWFADMPEDKAKFHWVEDKIYIEKIHAFASQADYATFKKMIDKSNYKMKTYGLKDFPDFKIRLLASLLNKYPFLYWSFFKLI